jgi:nitronate monooxygenase
MDPDNLTESDPSKMNFAGDKSKAWKDIWGCGQGIGVINKIQTTAELIAQLKREFADAKKRVLAA